MEQIATTFGINGKLILIQILNFGILLFLLRRFLYRPVIRIMNERQAKIEKGMEDAKSSAAELVLASNNREETIRKTKEESKAILDNALLTAGKIKDSLQKEAEEKAKEIINYATAQAQEEKNKMMAEVKTEILGLAKELAEKVLREHIDQKKDGKYIASTLR